jgi:hypothetical protein
VPSVICALLQDIVVCGLRVTGADDDDKFALGNAKRAIVPGKDTASSKAGEKAICRTSASMGMEAMS